jgi:hypothetical protein
MMAREKAPAHPLPPSFRPAGGTPYRVTDKDDWVSVAKDHSVDVKTLIYFNFHTNIPEEVNWYLRRHVGCKKSRDHGLNWAFSSDALPGIIFIPPGAKRVPPPRSVVVPWEPLPDDAKDRFNKALDALEHKVNASSDKRSWRYLCWIRALRAGADDRVIEWSKICPAKTGALGAAYIVGPCNLADGTPVDQILLEKSIKSVSDVEKANTGLFFITFMRSDILFDAELTSESLHLENFRRFHDQVVSAIDKLDKWANNPMGGSSAMPPAYISIKDWIGTQQRNPNSIYSCL